MLESLVRSWENAEIPLMFGAGPLGNLFEPMSDATARTVVERAWLLGIRHFDTAPHYGRGLSERRLGDALRGRAGFTVSTKVGRLMLPDPSVEDDGMRDGFRSNMPFRPVFDYTADGILRSYEASLHRLGLAKIDLLLVHDIGRMTHGPADALYWDQLTTGGGLRALERLRDEEAVAIGVGVNEVEACLRLMREIRLDVVLIAGRYTLLDQSALTELLGAAAVAGTKVLLGAPFNSGILASGAAGATTPYYDYAPASAEIIAHTNRIEAIARAFDVPLAAAALQFPLAHPAVSGVVAGFRTVQQVEQSIAWMHHAIPAKFWSALRSEGLLDPDAPLPSQSQSANSLSRGG